jgi:hypothetical protein
MADDDPGPPPGPPPPPPDDDDEPPPGAPPALGGRQLAEEDLATLMAMGFERPQCELALAFGRGNVEAALQILLNPEIMKLSTFAAGL